MFKITLKSGVPFTLGSIALKFNHRNDAATSREKQDLSDDPTAWERSWYNATCYFVHNSHGIQCHGDKIDWYAILL